MAETEDELRSATERGKKAMAIMTQRKVPLTPENYHVWYEYLAGVNEGLTEDINRIVSSGKPFTTHMNKHLYVKHFATEHDAARQKEKDALEQIHNETQKVLKSILDDVLNTHGLASEYGTKLEAYSEELNQAGTLSQMQGIIGNVIKDTAHMAASSQRLEEKLHVVSSQAENLSQELKKTQKEALLDALTGLHNRRAFDRKIGELCTQYKDNGVSFSAIMLDIDYFKRFNDTYGHKVGDAVLQAVAAILRESLRVGDYPARYGGEEFVVLLRTDSLAQAGRVAEEIRTRMADKRFRLAKSRKTIGQITVSLGIAKATPEDTPHTVIERADKALYLAKNSGRNNTKSEKDLEPVAVPT